jgi:molybdate transport system substrate-binding protein
VRKLPVGLFVVLALALAACGNANDAAEPGGSAAGSGSQRAEVKGTITVLAAASLTETFTVLGKEFERAHPGASVKLSFGASSTLAQQITNGAPADVFAAASPSTMKQVTKANAATGEPTIFVRNRLQITVPKGNPAKVAGLKDFANAGLKLSLCAKEAPCGSAAAKAFDAAGVAPKPDTYGADVKAVLTTIRLGEADAGLVYRTDVIAAGDEVEGIDFPQAGKAINDYPIATLAEGPNQAGGKAFVEFVLSSKARQTFTAAGFDLP